MTQDEAHRLELLIVEGFSAVRGDINRLAQDQGLLRQDSVDHEARLRSLESRRFPLPTIGGLCGVAAVLLSVIQVLGKG